MWRALPLVLLLGCTNFSGGRDAGDLIDDLCFAGKLSQAQADAVNSTPWEEPGERPDKGMNEDFCEARAPEPCVQKGDRVMARQCSNLIRRLRGNEPTD